MLRRVALVRTDVSEELGASFVRVTQSVNYEQHKLQLATDICCEEILGISSQVPPKCRFLQEPQSVTFQKTPFFIKMSVGSIVRPVREAERLSRQCGILGISSQPYRPPQPYVTCVTFNHRLQKRPHCGILSWVPNDALSLSDGKTREQSTGKGRGSGCGLFDVLSRYPRRGN
jgi:hypothetical protein